MNLTAGDFNKDGRPDLAAWAAGTAGTVRTVLNETDFLPEIPSLKWIKAGALTRLMWYTNYAGFALEYRASLEPASPWQATVAAPLTIDCQNFYTISTNQPGFYRLTRMP